MYRQPARRAGPNWMGISFLLLAVFLALVGIAILQTRVAGPPATDDPTSGATESRSPSAGPTDASGEPSSPGPSEAPASPAPTEPPATPSPSASASDGPGAAAECTGTDDNREFLATAADNLRFDVYCAALPARWALSRGTYSGQGGGRIEISYRGPGGATLLLRQGNACAGEDDCPPGEAVGSASFGDIEADLRAVGEEFALVAEGDGDVLYVAEFGGVDEATARAIGEAMLRVE